MRPGRAERRGRAGLAARGAVVAVAGMLLLGACGGDDDDAGDSGGAADTSPSTESAAPLQILVTNDDGFDAVGIDALVEALRVQSGVEVTVVAPATNQSGTGDKTTAGPLERSEEQTASGFPAVAVAGFPADSVIVALDELGVEPDLVMSGINVGQNIGPLADVSGTVGAAKTAQRRGIPALAVSQGGGAEADDYASTAQLAVDWLDEHRGELDARAEGDEVASLNVPTCPAGEARGVVDTELGTDGQKVGDPVDCTSEVAEADLTDDITAFLNGYASLVEVPMGPQPEPVPATAGA